MVFFEIRDRDNEFVSMAIQPQPRKPAVSRRHAETSVRTCKDLSLQVVVNTQSQTCLVHEWDELMTRNHPRELPLAVMSCCSRLEIAMSMAQIENKREQ